MQDLLLNLINLIVFSFAALLIHQFVQGYFTYTFSGHSSLGEIPQSDDVVFPQGVNDTLPEVEPVKVATIDWVKPVVEEPAAEVDVIAIAKLPAMKVMELRELGKQYKVKGAARARKQDLVSALRYKLVG